MSGTSAGEATAPQILIDVSNTLEAASISGIQRVTLELATALERVTTVQMLDARSGRFRRLRGTQRRRLISARNGRTRHALAHRVEQRAATLPLGALVDVDNTESILLDLEASWHAPIPRSELLPRFSGHSAALIHDVLPITNPEWFPAPSVARFTSWFASHIDAGSTLLAVSNASADAVASLGHDRPAVIPIGASTSQRVGGGLGILMIGTVEPRKGHALLLDALDLLGDAAPVVDVVGRAGWDAEALTARLEQHPHVRWHRSIDDADLETLWGLSGLLIQPSLGEGFGLPVVEALQRCVAVATSDIAVLREVGRGQTTVVETSAAAWADTLRSFADAPEAWPRPIDVDWPTWDASATHTLAALAHRWPDGKAPGQ